MFCDGVSVAACQIRLSHTLRLLGRKEYNNKVEIRRKHNNLIQAQIIDRS